RINSAADYIYFKVNEYIFNRIAVIKLNCKVSKRSYSSGL
ncbi:MAG: hypothetical protein ACI91R_000867, partial [Vicingaceae bacterium]